MAARSVRKSAAKRGSKGRKPAPAKRPAKVAKRKSAAGRGAAKPRKPVARPRPAARVAARSVVLKRPAPAGGRAKVLAKMQAGRDALAAAMQALKPAASGRPIAPGKWTARELVLHLAFWDEWLLGVLPPAWSRGTLPAEMSRAQFDTMNAQAVAAGAALSWEQARSLWTLQRELLLGLVGGAPATPVSRWSAADPVAGLLLTMARHDLHHAAQLRAARRAPAPGPVPAFARQSAGATAKELVMFELERARVAVLAALQGLPPGVATRPLGPGKWSPLEITLHLVASDRMRLEEFERLRAGESPSWAGMDDATMAALNERQLGELRGAPWDAALRLLHTTRAELVAALQAVPAEPAETWTAAHSFGATMLALPKHDRHHAQQIKLARIAGA